MNYFSKAIIVFFSGICLILQAYGETYFQQEVNYSIAVKLDDINHELDATEQITYINNSPDTLNFLWFHLWPNAYKNGQTAFAKQQLENGKTDFYHSSSDDKGYIDGIDFKVNGEKVEWIYDADHIDMARVNLNDPLLPGDSILIATPFHVKLPRVFSRLGHEEQSYMITQWYPKPAVYDMNGWHPMPYLDQGEFYSEFGRFEVSITVPENYVVAATGNLQNDNERSWLDTRVHISDSIISRLKSQAQREGKFPDIAAFLDFPASSENTKTITYVQDNVHDFAWFADKRYFVQRDTITLPSGHEVATWLMFIDQSAPKIFDWEDKGMQDMKTAIIEYSKHIGDYPYNNVTAVSGALEAGGGMEYPTITVTMPEAIIHEVGHNWFYGILGSNERVNPWMDESINTFYENRFSSQQILFPSFLKKFTGLHIDSYEDLFYPIWLILARENKDQGIGLHSKEYTDFNYGVSLYMKGPLAFNYLMDWLGEEEFDRIMKLYFERWKFRHPSPGDLRKIFEEEASKNTNWFFNYLIQSNKDYDLKISSFEESNDTLFVHINNKGDANGPFSISAIKNGEEIHREWYYGFAGKNILSFPAGDYDILRIDFPEVIPEVNRKNNFMKTSGVLKKVEPFRLKFFGSMEQPEYTNLYYSPVIGWNNYDKTMLGLALYNKSIPVKKLEYVAMPLYSTRTNELTGSFSTELNYFPENGPFSMISPVFGFKSYHYDSNPLVRFKKYASSLFTTLRKQDPRSSLNHNFRLRFLRIDEEQALSSDVTGFTATPMNYYSDLNYKFSNDRVINPFSLETNLEYGENYLKSSFTANYKVSYRTENKSLDIRFFAGKFIYEDVVNPFVDYRFRLGGRAGYQDYLYDHIFLGRSEFDGVFSQQFVEEEGAFKVWTAFGQSWDWISTVNIKASLPLPIALKAYSDIGTFSNADEIVNGRLLYNAGLQLPLFGEVMNIYFPLLMSKELDDNLDLNGRDKYMERIRFSIKFDRLNPLKRLQQIADEI